jgi:DeoR/GlpR family transcriptional regulator of sugar metabolism
VNKNGEVKIEQLRDQFNVSEVTLRRDLEILESQNAIRRIRGGAAPINTTALETEFLEKLNLNTEHKKEIAKKAAAMVEDGQAVMLSAGTTTTYIARELVNKKSITVITTAVNIAQELAGYNHITVIMLGGVVRSGSYATVGHTVDSALTTMNADFAFVGVDGVHAASGFTTPHLMEGRTDALMFGAANQGVIVADSSKFGKIALTPVAQPSEAVILITDKNAPDNIVQSLIGKGCKVII